MLCSDLMGRGMNFRKVRLVINYGVPRFSGHGRIELRKYDQRVGRTGRMEDRGMALTLFKYNLLIYF
jgi:superfamily II DNA/RNA helicase